MILEFEINYLPPLQNQLNVMHWAKRMREKKLILAQLIAFIPPKFKKKAAKASLTLTRYSSRQPDFDGLCGSFKPLIDGLVRLGVLEDDSPKIIGYPTYQWEKSKRGQGRIKVRVEFE